MWYSKKIFVRGVVRGIHFWISLLQRLSPEGGQNWHRWPSPMCCYMHKSHLYTTLTHHSGRKQRLCQSHLPYWVTFLRLAQLSYWEQLAPPSRQLRDRIDKILCFHPLAHLIHTLLKNKIGQKKFLSEGWEGVYIFNNFLRPWDVLTSYDVKNVDEYSRKYNWPCRMRTHRPIARYTHICMILKKNCQRGRRGYTFFTSFETMRRIDVIWRHKTSLYSKTAFYHAECEKFCKKWFLNVSP